jgi:hypothetical protein
MLQVDAPDRSEIVVPYELTQPNRAMRVIGKENLAANSRDGFYSLLLMMSVIYDWSKSNANASHYNQERTKAVL